jgi:hypothetical protein
MPVIDSLFNNNYYAHDYIPSVSAVIEYVSSCISGAYEISYNTNIPSESNATEKTLYIA